MTVHNSFAALMAARHRPEVYYQVLERGISDCAMDKNLSLSDKNYYRSTFHTREYIAKEWTEHFEVLTQYSCANGIAQDFVVMKAKA